MKPSKTRLTALLVALLMALGLAGAGAEANTLPPAPTSPFLALVESGLPLEMDFSLQMNPSLGGLLGMMTGQPMDEESLGVLNTALAALNKLKTRVIASISGVSGFVGTDKGSLVDFQVAANPETLENAITTSILPGIVLSLDPSALEAANAGPQLDPGKMRQLASPYLRLASGFLGGIRQETAMETGNFEVEGYGSFTSKAPLVITTHMAAGFMEQVLETYKNDQTLQGFVKEMGQTGQNLSEEAQSPEDLEKSLAETIAKLRGEEDKPVMAGEYYEGNGKSLASLLMETPDDGSVGKLDLFNEGFKGSVKLLLKAPAYVEAAIEGETPATEPAEKPAIDWAAAEKDILSGANFSDTLLTLTYQTKDELPMNGGEIVLSMHSAGMNLGARFQHDFDPDRLEAKGSVGLSLLSPDPLLTVNYTIRPAAEDPIAPLTDGGAKITIKEGELAEGDNALLEASLQQAMPALLERLNIALPEEAPALLQLLQGGAQEEMPEPAPANP